MRNYTLAIELSFMSESDAVNILDRCSELMSNGENKQDFVQDISEQCKKSVKTIDEIVTKVSQDKTKIDFIQTEINATLRSFNETKTQVEQSVIQLEQRLNTLKELFKQTISEVDSNQTIIQKTLTENSNHVSDINKFISEALQRIEACVFIRDMSKIPQTLMHSGKATLMGKDDLGNWVVKRNWQL